MRFKNIFESSFETLKGTIDAACSEVVAGMQDLDENKQYELCVKNEKGRNIRISGEVRPKREMVFRLASGGPMDTFERIKKCLGHQGSYALVLWQVDLKSVSVGDDPRLRVFSSADFSE